MFRSIKLLFLLLIVATAVKGQVALEQTTFDLGQISLLNEDVIDLNLTNHTEGRLFIIKIASDDRTQIKFTSRSIQPQESEYLRIKLNPSKLGKYETKVQLYFGQNLEPIILAFSAEVMAIPENQLQACPDFSGKHAAAVVQGGFKKQEKGEIQFREVGVFKESELNEYLLAKKEEIEVVETELEIEAPSAQDQEDKYVVEVPVEESSYEKEVPIKVSNEESATFDNSYRPNNIVFLLDASTSMQKEGRMDLLKASMKELLQPLREIDQIAIISYAGEAKILLASTSAVDKDGISLIIESIPAEGSTNAVKGLTMALQVATRNFIEEGNNQIILATDGDFDIGSKNRRLRDQISRHAEQQIFISVVGIKNPRWTNKSLNEIASLGGGDLLSLKSDKNLDVILEEVKKKSLK